MKLSSVLLISAMFIGASASAAPKSYQLACEFVCNQSAECDVQTLDPSRAAADPAFKQARVQLRSTGGKFQNEINGFYSVEVNNDGALTAALTYKPAGFRSKTEFSKHLSSIDNNYYYTANVNFEHFVSGHRISATLICNYSLRESVAASSGETSVEAAQ